MKKMGLKRTVSLIVALLLMAAMCPAAPAAQAADTDTCPCCGKAISRISWTEYGKWSNMFGAVDFSKAGHYKITSAFSMKKEFTIAANVTINFNGYLLRSADGKRCFTVASGGNLTLVNTGGNNGRLEGQNATGVGGTVKVNAGGTLNVLSGRVIGKAISYDGGAIYNEGTVNLYGGTVEGGTASGKSGGNIYNKGTLNICGGTVEGGNATCGGNIYNTSDLIMDDGAVTGGTATGEGGYGGNIYNAGTVTLNGGTISDGTSQDNGGNIYCSWSSLAIYGGTVSGGIVTGGDGFTAYGGNIYVTSEYGAFDMYGGTVTGGTAEGDNGGGNIALFSGAVLYMYGGTIENGVGANGANAYFSGYGTFGDEDVEENRQYSALYALGGTITGTGDADLSPATVNTIIMYNCRYDGSQDITGFVADCACYSQDDTGYTVWNAGYVHGTCTNCIYAASVKAGYVTPVSGSHTYEFDGDKTYTCTVCGHIFQADSIAASVNGTLYESLAAALNAAGEGATIQLLADATLTEAVVASTLDLNGHTLTADSFTSAVSGNVIDTSAKSAGKLVCSDVTLAENNPYLPVTMDDGIHFCPVEFTQWIEPQDVDTTKVKFYFTQRAAQTILDDAINGGNTEIDVQIRLTWTDSTGTAQDKTYLFGTELLQKYAEKWDSRVFVTTIVGTSGITDLTCTYQVTSKATSGTTLSASTMIDAGYIHENLTWEQINSYPIKTTDMTVEEMRQLCVDFMEFNKTFLWTPDTTVNFTKNSSGTADVMNQGTVYGGLPYVGVASGNPYRMMDYINPDTGLLDMKKAIPALENSDSVTMAEMKYFGNQCSICVYWGWGRVMNSTNYRWTSSAVPYNGFIVLGDIQIPDTVTGWNKTYGTDECLAENGDQVAFGGYAQLQKADGMVYYTTAGHLIMAYSDPVVVYNDDGTINGDESYIYIIDQAQKWEECTNDSGDTYLRKSSVNAKKTFQQLFDSNYIPFTFAEFLGTDPIEVTEVSLTNSSGTAVLKGTVSETDRSFVATKNLSGTLTWSNLFTYTVESNYGITDAYIIVYDNYGNEQYKHAVRTATAGNMALDLVEEGEMVTTWETKALTSGRTYRVKIEVQLATGERPVIYEGKLTA